MTNILKMGLLTLAIGSAFTATDSRAAVSTHQSDSNAVNYCQSFTPGVTNTIRNRAIGAENVGSASIAIACNYASTFNQNDGTDQTLKNVFQLFYNNSSAPLTVSCTLSTGILNDSFGFGSNYTVTKTVTVAPGAENFIAFSGADNPGGASPTLANQLVGVTCLLPKNAIATDNELLWDAEDGIGT